MRYISLNTRSSKENVVRHHLLPLMSWLFALSWLFSNNAPSVSAHPRHVADYPYPHVHSLVRDPANAQHIFALGNPEAYESFDGGRSWEVRGAGVPTAHYARLLFAPQSDTLWSYTPGIAGFHRSSDGGRTWPKQTDFLLRDVVVREVNGKAQLLAVAHDLRFMVSPDGGITWHARSVPWGQAGDARLAQLADAAQTLIVVASGKTYRSIDGGITWQHVGSWPAQVTPVRLFASANERVVYAIAHRGQYDPRPVGNTLLRTLDQGRTWQTAGIRGTWAAVGAYGDRVVAATWRGDVWYHDGGRWDAANAWQRWPLALVQPPHLREDVNPTPTVTDLLPGPDGDLVVSTVLGMYRAEQEGLPLQLRSRGLIPTAALPTAPLASEMFSPTSRYFGATGHSVDGAFLAAWEHAGGVAGLGYPLTEPYLERSVHTNIDQLVQLFERGRLEQNAAGTVLAARIVAETYGIEARTERSEGKDCAWSEPTGHNICGKLLTAWQARGAEAGLGWPLDEATVQNNRRVQHFERGRLEESLSEPYAPVQMGLVGREEAQRRGWLP